MGLTGVESTLSEPQTFLLGNQTDIFELITSAFIQTDLRYIQLHSYRRQFAVFHVTYSVLFMDEISDDWEFIGDIPDVDELTSHYVPPVAKSSSLLPPPTTHIYPRTPAAFQVPTALQSSSSSTVVSPPDAFLIPVVDLQRMIYQHFIGKVQDFIVHRHISFQTCNRE